MGLTSAIVTVMLAITALTRIASASCENGIEARSPQFSLVYYDTKPDRVDPTYNRRVVVMWDRMAVALAIAARIQRRIDQDHEVRAMFAPAPVTVQLFPNGSIAIGPGPDRIAQGRSDSLRSLTQSLSPRSSSEVSFYTVELARSVRRPEKDGLLVKVRALARRRISPGWQLTLALDWIHRDCNVGDWDRPNVFVVSNKMAGRTTYTVLSGLYFARDDATKAAQRISEEFRMPTRVAPIRLTGSLLRTVFPPV